jgi:hypothetical protein
MDRIVVFGRGGAAKSVFARALGARIGAKVIELDKLFWSDSLEPLTAEACPAERPRRGRTVVVEPRLGENRTAQTDHANDGSDPLGNGTSDRSDPLGKVLAPAARRRVQDGARRK